MAKNRLLDELAKLIGMQNAILLTRRYGGRSLSVPKADKLHETHPLVLTIGSAPANAMAMEYGGTMLNLPLETNALLQVRNTTIVEGFLAGESVRGLSIAFGLDRKYIQKLIDAAGHREVRLGRSVT